METQRANGGTDDEDNVADSVVTPSTAIDVAPVRSGGDRDGARARRHIAVVVAHGPEVRALIHTGLTARLAAEYDVTILTSNPGSAAFRHLPPGVDVRPIPGRSAPRHDAWRHRVLALHRAWLEARGQRKWTHRLPRERRRRGPKQWLVQRLATDRVVRGAVALERAAGRAFGTDRDVARCFETLGIDLLFGCSYNSQRARPLLQTARNLGVPTVVVANSWKDVFVQAHVPVPVSRLLLWSDSDVAEFANRNPFFPSDRVQAVGSLHLAALEGTKILSREAFCARVGLDPDRPIVCYTAAAPQAVVDEVEIIRTLADRLGAIGPAPRPQLLIRANPMEDGSRFADLVATARDVVLQRPEWEWVEERDWCCSLSNDLRLWASTIAHSLANVSIPSTVTLEFLARGRPVINICFDAEPEPPVDRSARRFWDAGFYRRIRDRPGVHAAGSIGELSGILGAELRAARQREAPTAGPHRSTSDPVGSVLATLDAVLAGHRRS